MTLKPKYHLSEVKAPEETSITNLPRLGVRHAQGLGGDLLEVPVAGEEDGDRIVRGLLALGMEDGESVVDMVLPGDYSGAMLFFFENGKAARVELSAYATTDKIF